MAREDLLKFLRSQPATVLADVLAELAADHDEVRKRLERMQLADSPAKLSASFGKQLAAWKRSRRFHDHGDAPGFAAKLEQWLNQVARELTPRDPAAAAALFEAFIEMDGHWFESADDSDGDIGGAVCAACRNWLQAAARCETPAEVWRERLLKLADGDEYGARQELLQEAGTLLPEAELRVAVDDLERRMAVLVTKHASASQMPYEVIRVSSAMSLLAQALGDPDVKVRSVLSYRSDPNPMQQEQFVRAYLDAGRAADAMKWLQEDWGRLDDRRQRLLAEAYAQLGQPELSHPLRKRLFEDAPSVEAVRLWIDGLLPRDQVPAQEHAKAVAMTIADPTRAALILMELGAQDEAERVLVDKAEAIDGSDYITLPELAKTLEQRGLLRGAVAIYRALMGRILERAYAPAYGHAARYLACLRAIASDGIDLAPLVPHQAVEDVLRTKHGRKSAFWARVSEGDGV
ncbi:MAG: DUF6880 family protein [Betaproteobacteria bacterium]